MLFFQLLLQALLLHPTLSGSGCAPGSSSCSNSNSKKSDCKHWCEAPEDCPADYPIGNDDDWSYCGVTLPCDFDCYACNIGYYAEGAFCLPCPPGRESVIAATSCSQCNPGQTSTGGSACSDCDAGKVSSS